MFREIGDRWGLGTALGGLAEVQNSLGDFDAAAATLEESMRLMREVGAEEDATNAQVWLAGIWARKGDVDRARSELRALLEQRSRERSPVSVSMIRFSLGELARHTGDLAEAGRQYRAALLKVDGSPQVAPHFNAMLEISLAYLAIVEGDLATAERRITAARDVVIELRDMPLIARAALGIADLRLAGGDAELAAQILGVAEGLRGLPDRFNVDGERVAAATEAVLGAARYRAAFARGRSLDRPRALELLGLAPSAGGPRGPAAGEPGGLAAQARLR